MSVSATRPRLPLPFLLLPFLLLPALLVLTGVAGEENLQVTQPVLSMSVAAGQAVTLPCKLSSQIPLGPVKWFRGNGPDWQLVYDFKGGPNNVRRFPRITSVTDQTKSSNLDLSIHIMDLSTEDSGIYYCLKFRKGTPDDIEFKSGPGTLVTVRAKPSLPEVSGPFNRASPSQAVNLTCESTGFFPRDIHLKWLENGMELPALQTLVLPSGDASSYTVISITQVTLAISSLSSQVTCQVAHSELQSPLRGHVNMSQFLRVIPTVSVSAHPVPSLQAVVLICHMQRFYPEDVHITWLERNPSFKTCKALDPTTNPDGTFSQDHHLLVNTLEQEDKRLFSCQVWHNAQPPVQASVQLSKLGDQQQGSLGPRASGSLYGTLFLLFWKLLPLTVLSILYVFRRNHPCRPSQWFSAAPLNSQTMSCKESDSYRQHLRDTVTSARWST